MLKVSSTTNRLGESVVMSRVFVCGVKLSDQRSEVLPDGSASQPGKEVVHLLIASLDPVQRTGLAGSGPVTHVAPSTLVRRACKGRAGL